MAREPEWIDAGVADELAQHSCRPVRLKNAAVALTFKDGKFGAVSHVCNHVGGPLGEGRLDGDYIVCPWHHWKFHRLTGEGEPGFEEDCVPAFPVKVETAASWSTSPTPSRRNRKPHEPHPLARDRCARPGRCGLPASRPPRWTGQPALLRLRPSARATRSKPREAGRGNQAHPAERSEVPHLRGLLLQEPRRLHLALLDHPDGRRTTSSTRSTRRWCTGPT